VEHRIVAIARQLIVRPAALEQDLDRGDSGQIILQGCEEDGVDPKLGFTLHRACDTSLKLARTQSGTRAGNLNRSVKRG
jgi:hypothetical protein